MISPNWYPSDGQLRQFGFISLAGFGLIGMLVGFHLDSWVGASLLWSIGMLTCVFGLLRPRLVLPVFLVMTALTLPIGWLVGQLLLRVLYYGVVFPLGRIRRILGKDELQLEKRQRTSYWLPYHRRSDPKSYYRQG